MRIYLESTPEAQKILKVFFLIFLKIREASQNLENSLILMS